MSSSKRDGGILIKGVAFLGVCALAGWGFLEAGNFLVVEDPFDHADVAIVLSGDPTGRLLAARDLYRLGRVDRVLIVPEPPRPFEQELVRLGLVDSTSPPFSRRILEASGVPAAAFEFLPEPVDGTIHEAVRVQQWLMSRQKNPRRVVVITSRYASRRARWLFRHFLRDGTTQVVVYPNPYDLFVADRWWSNSRNALHVVMEYNKLVANFIQLNTAVVQAWLERSADGLTANQ